jgi:hypothetical protein
VGVKALTLLLATAKKPTTAEVQNFIISYFVFY